MKIIQSYLISKKIQEIIMDFMKKVMKNYENNAFSYYKIQYHILSFKFYYFFLFLKNSILIKY